jgi:hypothetical protein
MNAETEISAGLPAPQKTRVCARATENTIRSHRKGRMNKGIDLRSSAFLDLEADSTAFSPISRK